LYPAVVDPRGGCCILAKTDRTGKTKDEVFDDADPAAGDVGAAFRWSDENPTTLP
jgi:hypothetical protein